MNTKGIAVRTYFDADEFKSTCRLLDDLHPTKSEGRFFYYLAPEFNFDAEGLSASNMCLDYSIVLDSSLSELLGDFARFDKRYVDLRLSLFHYIDRCASVCADPRQVESLLGLKLRKATDMFDALQRILFINSLQWQFGHHLVGLGRLDQWLLKYFAEGGRANCLEIIKEFLLTLHRYYKNKSNELLGDTGQIIILGGTDERGNDQSNGLTELFISALTELHLPDPKLMLRYSQKTPDSVLSSASRLIESGSGSPIMANDERVIPALIDAGYTAEDAHNYAVSACWEPFACGKAVSRNNLYDLNFAEALNEAVELMLSKGGDRLSGVFDCLRDAISEKLSKLRSGPWQEEPIESLFIRSCRERKKTIGGGGACHYDVGFLTTGLSNCVNGILAIDRLCFKEGKLTIAQLNAIRKANFEGFDSEQLVDRTNCFGSRSRAAIEMTNRVLKITNDAVLECHVGDHGESLYFGLSSSNYLAYGSKNPASFDGRKANAPYGVHVSNDFASSPLDVIYFFRSLDLPSRCVNGNVIDSFFDASLFSSHPEFGLQFLRGCCNSQAYEFQMNVTNFETLVDAKLHPEKHENLIVRVWGFSSYFNDLPIEYKDLLIERAKNVRGQSF